MSAAPPPPPHQQVPVPIPPTGLLAPPGGALAAHQPPAAISQLLPLELIDQCIGSKLWISMKGDKEIIGTLLGFDDFVSKRSSLPSFLSPSPSFLTQCRSTPPPPPQTWCWKM